MPVVGMDSPRAHLTLWNGIPGDLRPGKEGGTRIGDRRSVRRKEKEKEGDRGGEVPVKRAPCPRKGCSGWVVSQREEAAARGWALRRV